MSHQLVKTTFGPNDLQDVQVFDCGDAPHEREVAEWLKATTPEDNSIIYSLHSERSGPVWLYRLEDGTPVGFAALGKSEWRWQGKNDPKVPVTVIIWVGIDRKFHGKPDGPKGGRYSMQIMKDLIDAALLDKSTHPAIALCVHKDNQRAIHFYQQFGFAGGFEPIRNKETKEVEYLRLAVVLDAVALSELRERAKKKK